VIIPEPGDLKDLVRDLHRQGTPWLPAGLASRLDWGPPCQPCRVLSTAALRGVVEHNPGDFVVRVAAGTPLEELQAQLAAHQQWLAVDPPPATTPGSGFGSIGGLVARGLAGGYRQRYLGVRDQLIGITILRADGVLARAGGKVVKNVAGYDLMRLFCGSWGSLGLITELTLRTMPLPQHRAGLLLSGPAEALLERVQALLRSGLSPERLDLWNPALAAAAGHGAEALLLVGLAGVSGSSLEEQLQAAARIASADRLPPIRQARRCDGASLPTLQAAAHPRPAAGPSDPAAWLLRLGVTPSRAADLLGHPALRAVPVDLAAGSGLAMAWAPAEALSQAHVADLRQHCRALGGQLTVLRQPAGSSLSAWDDAPSRPLIEAVKTRFDPLGQLAPGRLPGVAGPATAAVADQARAPSR